MTKAEQVVNASKQRIVDLSEVSFRYPNGKLALTDLSLSLYRGTVCSVVGPSGCGKSTLLALLSKMQEPAGGEIEWHESEPQGEARHQVSMMFQKDTLLPWMTVAQNSRLFGKLHKSRRAETDELVDELLEMVGLASARNLYPYELSGGMRRRLAFVVAMSAKPDLLLLDEPFSALDEPTRVQIHQSVLDVFERSSTTVVLVTHDLAEAASLSDQIVMLSGSPGTLYKRYDVDLGDQRDVLQLRGQPEYQELVGELWRDLGTQLTPRKQQAEATS